MANEFVIKRSRDSKGQFLCDPSNYITEERFCACGCGKSFQCPVKSKRRFITHHNFRLTGKKHHSFGKSPSEQTIKKRLESLSGFQHTEKARQKISQTLKGRIPWNKGLHIKTAPEMTDITKAKISQSLQGNKLSEATKEKLRQANIGRIQSPQFTMLGRSHSKETKEKMSQTHLGHPVNNETRAKLRAAFKGEKAPKWRGGISRAPWSFDFNEELKELIRKRDNYKCQLCGAPQEEFERALSVHHIDYDKANSDPENLITLCISCHSKTNDNRESWQLKLEQRIG